ncbi:hypothetical protein QAD02_003819 [Eretmocerus hayati]|uniref:Uncharacterized protein n=1 Tax=Eretmocerus hayati TaxID=131215 RepID=A0ACC2NN17_9HYME|nr:hypothetical protein QAD02_003819 [Eretmocerus hayati]
MRTYPLRLTYYTFMAIFKGLVFALLCLSLGCDALQKNSLRKRLNINADVRVHPAITQSILWYLSEKTSTDGITEFEITSETITPETKLLRRACKIPIALTNDTLQITIFPLNKNRTIVNWTRFNETTYMTTKLFVDFDDCEVIIDENTVDRILNICPEVDYKFILPRKTRNGTVHIDTVFDEEKCSLVFRVDHRKLPKYTEDEIALENAEFVWTLSMALDNGNSNECLYFQSAERLKASLFYTNKVVRIFHPRGVESRWTGVSTSHGVLGLCKVEVPDSRFLNCSQGDLKTWTRLNFDYDPENSIMHNLPRGEYLILSMRKLPLLEGPHISNVIHLTRFSADGQKLLSIEVTKSQCHGVNTLPGDIYEDEMGDYCVSLLPRWEKVLTVRCFYKDSLKRKR